MSASKLNKLSRQALYEKVWSLSGVKLSAELGVSDVAIAKRCRKLNVPRPPRGYWAKLEAGQSPQCPALPPPPERVFIQEAQKPLGQSLEMPTGEETLHPLATGLFVKLGGIFEWILWRDCQRRVSSAT